VLAPGHYIVMVDGALRVGFFDVPGGLRDLLVMDGLGRDREGVPFFGDEGFGSNSISISHNAHKIRAVPHFFSVHLLYQVFLRVHTRVLSYSQTANLNDISTCRALLHCQASLDLSDALLVLDHLLSN